MHKISNSFCNISQASFDEILNSYGKFYEKISFLTAEKITEDALNPNKPVLQAEILMKYVDLNNKKVLEVGSGMGVNLIVWSKKYNIDGYGIEPDGEGFDSSYLFSKKLLKLNGIDEQRIINAPGENIPFDDNSFDIIYSTNVLEHVQDPYKVIDEAVRVLKPGGILQIVYPNYHSYFDGHYAVFHPPLISRKVLPWLVKYIYRRDPAYAWTIRTELNVFWTNKTIRKLKKKYKMEVLSLGEEVYRERMKNLNFEAWAGVGKIKSILMIFKKLKLNMILCQLIYLFRGWSPIILTIRKNG